MVFVDVSHYFFDVGKIILEFIGGRSCQVSTVKLQQYCVLDVNLGEMYAINAALEPS